MTMTRNSRPQRMNLTLSILLLICLASSVWLPGQTQVNEIRRVLIFNEFGPSSPGVALIDQAIAAALVKSPYQVELYSEYLETTLFPDESSQLEFRDWYIHKYRNRKPDVIIAVGPAPLKFLVESHGKYFPVTPIVFCGSTEEQAGRPKLGSQFTGVWNLAQVEKTLDAALNLQPTTQHVVVIIGLSQFDRTVQAIVRNDLRPYENRLDITYLADVTMPALLGRIQRLPKNTIIIFVSFQQDASGNIFINAVQSLPLVIGAANSPVFTLADTLVGHGAVGGFVASYAEQGLIAGDMTVRILNGEKPQDIPIVKGANAYMFDWRALRRWGFDEKHLPPDSIVLNREPSFWEAYKDYVIIGIALLLAQTVLIIGLLWQRAKKRIAEESLSESEMRLREAQGIAHCGSWVWRVDQDESEWSDEIYRILGLHPLSVVASTRLLHPSDEQIYASKLGEALQTHQLYHAEHTIVRPNGEERIVVEFGQPQYDSRGKPVRVIGTLLDVTEQRRAEQTLRESEQRFRTMADSAPVLMWIAGVDRRCTDFNRGWLEFTGRSLEEEVGDGWVEGVHPSDLQKCLTIYFDAFDKRRPFTMEYRLKRFDGEYRWITDTGTPRFLPGGTFAGYIGCCIDIHHQKETELARLELAHRLMNAQEKERTRIARELHDSIGQSIAVLSLQMQRAGQHPSDTSTHAHPGIPEITAKLKDIGIQVSRLSHQLHSAELEYLGLATAVASLCREFSEQYPITIECSCPDIPSDLDNNVALTFFRVIQEALHNIAKHSHAKTVQVVLTGSADELTLIVRDDGIGFEARNERSTAGLGLISMRERMHLIGGDFEITSRPNAGTEITAAAPLARADAEQALE